MLKKESKVYESLEILIDSIKESETYRRYRNATEEVSRQPGLQEQIDEYRGRNFLIRQRYDGDELLQELEKFEAETAAFRAQRLVDSYLSAELAFIRLKQDIDSRMLTALAFATPGSTPSQDF